MVKKILFTLIVVGLLSAWSGLSGLAVFTDQAVNNANTFTTGTVTISTSPATAFITYSDMAPGDEVTAALTVSNGGTLALRYAVTSTTTEDTLAAQLDLTIKSGVTTCTNGGFGVDGTVLYGAADLGSMAGVNAIGLPTQGADAGDRTLAASGSEVLCFNVKLPLTTGDATRASRARPRSPLTRSRRSTTRRARQHRRREAALILRRGKDGLNDRP